MEQKEQLKEKAKSMDPHMRIGKDGLTDGVLKELKLQLSKKKLIKVKFLKSAIPDGDKKKFARILAGETGAELINQVGFVVVLYKR